MPHDQPQRAARTSLRRLLPSALLALATLTALPAVAQRSQLPSPESGSVIPGAVTRRAAGTASADAPGFDPALRARLGLDDDLPWPPAPQPPVRTDACSVPIQGRGTTYHVGPGQALTELDQVPWLSLQAGDVVNIHARAEPYRVKVGLRAQGTAQAPIEIHGVTDAACRKPVISGEDAVPAQDARAQRFFNAQYSENLGVFLLFKGPRDPWGHRPQHLRFSHLRITGAQPKNRYTAQDGSVANYSRAAAGIYAVTADHLVIDQCEITGNGNGVFVNSKSREETSDTVIVRNSRIWDNGVPGSWYEHNLYVQARRALYEGNHIGPLVPGARGSSMKDRSSGTVVRFNRIVAAARAIDLVEIEGGVPPVLDDPLYNDAWVYGNLIENDSRAGGPGRAYSVKMIHWGGDNDPRYFRRGTLHFLHNTVRVRVAQRDAWYVGLFDLPGSEQRVQLRGNVIQNLGDAELRLGLDSGSIDLVDVNLIQGSWAEGSPGHGVRLRRSGRELQVTDAGLDESGRPRPGTPGLDRGQATPAAVDGWAIDHLGLSHQYAEPGRLVPRPVRGKAADLGAFELAE